MRDFVGSLTAPTG